MLREALPKIVTGTLPGPKAKAIIDRRAEAVPNGIGTAYKAVIERGEIFSSTGSAELVY